MLVHQQRIFLLVHGTLHVLAQVVHVAQVLLPVLVDDAQHDGFFEVSRQRLPAGFHAALQVGRNLDRLDSVGKRNQNVLELASLLAQHVFEDRQGLRGNAVALGAVGGLGGGIGFLGEFDGRKALKLGGVHRRRHGEVLEASELVGAKIAARLAAVDERFGGVVHAVGQVQGEALTRQGVAPAAVNSAALRVHDVVVLEQALAAAEVVFFDLLLGALDALGDH